MSERRTQAQRREATQSSLLIAARRLFGEHGYADTSIEDIAVECDLTVRPIYHYFKSKLGLFAAVTDQIEQELIERMQGQDDAEIGDVWERFMANCEDPHFRQIILIDAPTLLGRNRMAEGNVAKAARQRTAILFGRNPEGLSMTMLMGALSSAALYIAEHGSTAADYKKIRELIEFHSKAKSEVKGAKSED